MIKFPKINQFPQGLGNFNNSHNTVRVFRTKSPELKKVEMEILNMYDSMLIPKSYADILKADAEEAAQYNEWSTDLSLICSVGAQSVYVSGKVDEIIPLSQHMLTLLGSDPQTFTVAWLEVVSDELAEQIKQLHIMESSLK